MDYLEKISDANVLISAFRKASRTSGWKESTQRYEMNLLKNVYKTQQKLRSGTYRQMPFYSFTLTERGKKRLIKSMHISDRVVQRALCDDALIPALEKYLIYDNGASVKGKGVTFARNRLEAHLHRYYRETGSNEGYILLWDFQKFFDSIPHETLLKEKINDPEFMDFIKSLIETFRTDNSTEGKLKSVGIGSQISQICGVFYPTRLDTYCKVVKGIKYYGRYMDDIYIIHKSKEYLKELLAEMMDISEEMGLPVNTKKTQIVKLSHGFTFMKVKYSLTETGRVLKKVSPERITRERRRLKKFRKLMDEGKMPYRDIYEAYRSWRGGVKKCIAYRSLKNMDELYDELFIKPFINQEE